MADVEFEGPVLQFSCFETDSDDAEELSEFSRFYSEVHSPEVVSKNPGIVRGYRYELVARDPGAEFGARWIAVYEWESQEAAQRFIARLADPNAEQVSYTPFPPIWRKIARGAGRLIWRRLGESGPALAPPEAIFLEGIDPPSTADDDQLKEFDEFYRGISGEEHTSEACPRVTTYEIQPELSSIRNADPSHPRYCTIYQGDEAALPSPTGTSQSAVDGPQTWADRRTLWQLTYRRVSECMYPDDAHR